MKILKAGLVIATLVAMIGCQLPKEEETVKFNCPSTYGAGDVREAPTSIFVFAGQSNMVGMGQTIEYSQHDETNNVVVWIEDHWETYQESSCFGPDLQFAIDWQRDHPGQVVGFIKQAVAGTSMGDWQVNWDPMDAVVPTAGPLYDKLVATYQAAGSLPVNAFLWAQAESDTMLGEAANKYQERVQFFISNIRSVMGGTPFIMAETASVKEPYWLTISLVQTGLVEQGYVTIKVPTLDLPLADGLHYNSFGQIVLGNRFYAAWVDTLR